MTTKPKREWKAPALTCINIEGPPKCKLPAHPRASVCQDRYGGVIGAAPCKENQKNTVFS